MYLRKILRYFKYHQRKKKRKYEKYVSKCGESIILKIIIVHNIKFQQHILTRVRWLKISLEGFKEKFNKLKFLEKFIIISNYFTAKL